MSKFFNRWVRVVPWLVSGLFCLTPIIWFWDRDGFLLNGVDTNFPLDPLVWLARRLYVWNSIVNGGSDFSSSNAGFFFHFVQVFLYRLGLPLQQVELFSLIFWFSAIVLSSYLLSRLLFSGRVLVQLTFICLYTFNIYMFNTWENVKVANLALVAALPFGISTVLLIWKDKFNWKTSLLVVLTGLIISGGGINPSYIITFGLILTLFLFIYSFETDFKIGFRQKFVSYLGFMVGVMLVNFFWILPAARFVFSNIPTQGSIYTIGFTNWVDSLSQNTSILNILRLQGAWDWYAFDSTTGMPLYIPYALNYFTKIPFLLFSFLLPTMVFVSIFLINRGRIYLYISFVWLVIIGVFLGVGTHSPTGEIYRFLQTHLPFFSLFRSPWYIFTPALVLGMAGLTSLLVMRLYELVPVKYHRGIHLLSVGLIILNLIYCYPLVSGKIFRPGQTGGFYVNFPDYVFSVKEIEKSLPAGRIVSFPDDELEQFDWGYRGVESILALIIDRDLIFSSFNSGNNAVSEVIREFYLSLKKDQLRIANNLASKLDIGSIFRKYDQQSLNNHLPSEITNRVSVNTGKWSFYPFNDQPLGRIYSSNSLFMAYPNTLGASLLGVIPPRSILLNPGDSAVNTIPQLGAYGIVIASTNSAQSDLELSQRIGRSVVDRYLPIDIGKVDYVIDVPAENEYQVVLEKYRLEDFGLDPTKSLEAEINGHNVTLKIEKSDDTYCYFQPILIPQGRVKITFKLVNTNLISGGDFENQSDYTLEGNPEVSLVRQSANQHLSVINRGETDNVSVRFKVNGFDPLASYLVSLRYMHMVGNNGIVAVLQRNANSPLKNQAEWLASSSEWGQYHLYFVPVATSSELSIGLYSPPSPLVSNPIGTKILYDDLAMYKLLTNRLFLFKAATSDAISVAQIDYLRKSPSEYRGSFESDGRPFLMVFSENYSPDWKLEVTSPSQPESVSSPPVHFTANHYANAWFVERDAGKYNFKINYQPQKWYLIGSLISLISVILIVIFGIVKSRR